MLQAIKFRSFKPTVYSDLVIPVTVDVTPSQPLFLRDITGIEPVTAIINSKGYGVVDGEYYLGSKLPKRNIVMKFGLNTSSGYASVSAARALIYGYMMTTADVWLEFFTDDHVPVQIRGYVESISPTRFTEDPESQVSIICPMPHFVTDTKIVEGWANPDPVPVDQVAIPYSGNKVTGIDFTLDVGTGYNGAVILETRIGTPDSPAYQTFSIYDNASFSEGTELRVSTEVGSKYVEIRTDSGDLVRNILKLMDPDSWWMFLVPGTNWFSVRTPNGSNRRWSLKYVEKYGGI